MRKVLLILITLSCLYSAQTYVDSATSLIWQDNSEVKSAQKSWSAAKSYCQNLTLLNQSDWRLPSVKELQSIIDIKKAYPAIKNGFKNVAADFYWSSSEYIYGDSDAWIVGFNSGRTDYYDKSYKYYVRCVRSK